MVSWFCRILTLLKLDFSVRCRWWWYQGMDLTVYGFSSLISSTQSVIKELIYWQECTGLEYVWKLLGFSLHTDIDSFSKGRGDDVEDAKIERVK
jgi:hypothetical protein